jgi:hypothetical protein
MPSFSLEGPAGERTDDAALAGRVWLLGFLDARCAACGARLGNALEGLQYRLRNVGPSVGLLVVGTSAGTPLVALEEQRLEHHANPHRWRIAAGTGGAQFLGGLAVLAAQSPSQLESGRALALVDAQGRLRAVGGVEDKAEVDQLLSQLTLLLNE